MEISKIKSARDRAFAAYQDALEAQSLGMKGRTLTRQNISALRSEFEYWDKRLSTATRGGGRQFSLVRFRE
ncbi:TPA: hypothetical protein JWK76_002487 [Escherichia coli]|uniref:hypothetical protein n=1 Tax=Escherichia coli TaxID=562 RepID=UPI0010AB63FA|nr:hypothetical protein [Escherichia coli]EFK1930364.1 hypothetical protein [Escherichia coli]TJE73110.1 hypothetical protein C9209_15060 [Escherichia coli]HAX2928470.1 hypothetical protein [Escherichia coli]HAX3152928.1 hypothetical protein [Escherichia coli]HAX3212306.1 hypothetical protein [Escherichia coli]